MPGHIKHWWEFESLFQKIAKLLLEAGVSSQMSIFSLVARIAPEETLREKLNPLKPQHQKANKSLSVKCIVLRSPTVILKKHIQS